MKKEEFLRKDRLLKGVTEDGNFKISVVKTTDVVKDAKKKHNLSLLNTVILGKALTATMLMASELKGEERVQLRIDGNGPIGYLIAEANRIGEVRGYVKNPDAELDYANPNTTLGDGLGIGVLNFTKILYNEAEPRTSSIELATGDITGDIAHYLTQSEQIPSAIILDVGIDENGEVTEAGGLLVQRLPGAPEGQIDVLQEKLSGFAPINELLEQGDYIDDIMRKALSPIKGKELDRQKVDFFCRCTRERFYNALHALNLNDLEEMQGESQEMVCQYCNNKEVFSPLEIDNLINLAKARNN